MRVCIVQPCESGISETFLDAQTRELSAETKVVYKSARGKHLSVDGRPILSTGALARLQRKVGRIVQRRDWKWERTAAYLEAFRDVDVVLAQYGVMGVRVMEACRLANKPLVVHFHGYDASRADLIEKYRESYQEMFANAAAIIVVSRAMKAAIQKLGCPEEKIVINVYGAAQDEPVGIVAGDNPPLLLSVGRFVEKKAPQLTLVAFSWALQKLPGARLRMIGEGPLLNPCKDLAEGLGIAGAVEFLGAQPHAVVLREMRQARAFVQHSIVSRSGDSEGTPVAVIEAGAAGLPVVATKHAGIPDVAVDGQTALLVDEKDVQGMAAAMLSVLEDPALASRLGANAAVHVGSRFTVAQSTQRLGKILAAAASPGRQLQDVQRENEALLVPIAVMDQAMPGSTSYV